MFLGWVYNSMFLGGVQIPMFLGVHSVMFP